MIKSSKITYEFSPSEIAQILKEKITNELAGGPIKSIDVKFNVRTSLRGYGQDEHEETNLQNIEVIVSV
jgi:hypothetical protein